MLKSNSSPGLHGISSFLLKSCTDTLCYPISRIMTSYFNFYILPSIWKTASVTVRFKKDNKLDPNNYRPISLRLIAYKVMESIMIR
ncbi:unnamed protein product [Psylliodes chrysocephalus]|uniref:Reverse transcriptase n=1 Tax=Psylliodes chrysocephalus TaxID=3402493 RepID=A0A9P0CKY6_9CUCU|nr:unnamed protein product [Psylliodes chrysocephala]